MTAACSSQHLHQHCTEANDDDDRPRGERVTFQFIKSFVVVHASPVAEKIVDRAVQGS
jgi:hypothetical protein